MSSSFTVLLPNGSSLRMSRRVSLVPAGYCLVGADAAAIGDGDVGAHGLAHRVRDQVADRGLLVAHRPRRLSSSVAVVPMTMSSSLLSRSS